MDIIKYANHVEQGLTHADMARIYGYTEDELQQVLVSIGIKESAEDKAEERQGRRWTAEEDQYLIDNNGIMSVTDLSIELGRTYNAIIRRRDVLGIAKRKRRWTREEIEKLRKLSNEGLNNKEAGEVLGRTERSVGQIKHQEGIMTAKGKRRK